MHGVLADLLKWHQDEEQFVQDNRVKVKDTITYLPGFMTRFQNKRANVALEDLMDAPTFREVCKKWHRKLTKVTHSHFLRLDIRSHGRVQCFIDCIESGEFMHVYNTIIVLKELLPVYPIASVYELGGPRLDIAINDFVNKEKRGDLKIIGRAYAASFKSREHVWRPRVHYLKRSRFAANRFLSVSPQPQLPHPGDRRRLQLLRRKGPDRLPLPHPAPRTCRTADHLRLLLVHHHLRRARSCCKQTATPLQTGPQPRLQQGWQLKGMSMLYVVLRINAH